jgi:hypothetical protein
MCCIQLYIANVSESLMPELSGCSCVEDTVGVSMGVDAGSKVADLLGARSSGESHILLTTMPSRIML